MEVQEAELRVSNVLYRSAPENPYLAVWLSHRPEQATREDRLLAADKVRDFDTVARILALRKFYIQKYAHAVPTETALSVIARCGPIIEIGAGTGYWASLLREAGVDILCFDKDPPAGQGSSNHFHEGAACWTAVHRGEESEIDRHPDRTLLLCWPPPNSEMPARALRRYRGNRFIYIGELPDAHGHVQLPRIGRRIRKGVTIVHAFFEELSRNWNLSGCVELPHWEICVDNLYVFDRKSAAQP